MKVDHVCLKGGERGTSKKDCFHLNAKVKKRKYEKQIIKNKNK